MSSIIIVVDSGCDLTDNAIGSSPIVQVPLIARFGEVEILDSPAARVEFWQRYDISQPPQSSGPPVGAWADVFATTLQSCDEIIAITITGKHSVTYNSAFIAAADFDDRVHVFDSWSISVGEGILALRAAQLASEGQIAADILADLRSWRSRLQVHILLDTLDAVQRGGRLGPVMAAIKRMSSMLSIKPLLTIEEGVITFDGAVRSHKRGVKRLLESLQDMSLEVVAVGHTRAADAASSLRQDISAQCGISSADILLAEAGPALAVHAGPGALGLGFVSST